MTHIQCILVVLCSLCSTGTFAALEVISGNCISSSGGTCVASPNYATGDYPTYQPCTIENTVAGCISSEAFVTESTFDTLNVRRRGSTYSGSTSFSDVWLDNGDMIQWELDSSMQETGWKFCTSTCVNGVGPAPTGAPTLGTTDLSIVTGDCTLSDGGTCASSPNSATMPIRRLATYQITWMGTSARKRLAPNLWILSVCAGKLCCK
jgi:hypothetical protein